MTQKCLAQRVRFSCALVSVSLLLGLLTACPTARLIQADELAPAGAVEAGAPPDLIEAVSDATPAEQLWLRGYTYPPGWLAFVREVDANARAHGYHQITNPTAKMDSSLNSHGLGHEDCLRDYLSDDGKFEVELVNLNARRTIGIHEEGTAEYVIIGDVKVYHRPMR